MGGVEAHGEAGVVDQDVDLAPFVGQAVGQCGDGFGVGDVERHWQHCVAEFVAQSVQTVGAAGGGDDAMAVADETAGHGGAEAGGGAGYQDG